MFGGSWCPNTRAAATYINKYAVEYGIDTIYNFDFRLDGASSEYHVRVSDSTSETKTAGEQFNFLYGELVTRYITNLTDWVEYKEGTESSVNYTNALGETVNEAKVQVPFLFLYNKDNTVDNSGNDAADGTTTFPIVYGFEEMVNRDSTGIYTSSYSKDASGNWVVNKTYITEQYEEDAEALFKYIKTNNVKLTSFTDADYVRISFNDESAYNTTAGTAREGLEYHAGKPIFSGYEQINYHVVTYRQLTWLLQQEGDALILFGGTWCANTQAAIATINDYAVANDLTVYWFDPAFSYYAKDVFGYNKRSSSGYVQTGFIRRSDIPFYQLYVDLLTKYLTNVEIGEDEVLQYNGASYTLHHYVEYTDSDGNVQKIGKISVPYLFTYNKDAVDEDNTKAPIVAYYMKEYHLINSGVYESIYEASNYATYKAGTFNVIKAITSRVGQTAKEITIDRSKSVN
jgi:hypothetical protein